MIGDSTSAPREVHPKVKGRPDAIATDWNRPRSFRRHVALRGSTERAALGVIDQAIAIHRDAIMIAEVTETDGIRTGCRNFRKADRLKCFLDERQRIRLR